MLNFGDFTALRSFLNMVDNDQLKKGEKKDKLHLVICKYFDTWTDLTIHSMFKTTISFYWGKNQEIKQTMTRESWNQFISWENKEYCKWREVSRCERNKENWEREE